MRSLRLLGSTGEPWDDTSYLWFFENVGHGRCPVINISGGTEIVGCFLLPLPIQPLKPCTLGGPAPGMATEVVDDEGRPVRGKKGYLVCTKPAPSMTRGIWGDPERYIETYWSRWPGWWYHGDWASVDEDGCWFLHGRADESMNVAGRKVGPAEVEDALIEHPAVSEAAVIGVPDERYGEELCAWIRMRPGAEPLTADTVRDVVPPGIPNIAAVVATSGTTNAGIIDDLAGVGALALDRGWWFHVDGAYGGSGIFARSLRPKYNGLELADSFILDPHKWLFTPFDCCALLYRDPELARATHTQDASYLDVIHTSDGEWNPSDYAYHLTRRARGLPLWFSLAVYGLEAYRQAIEVAASLAVQTAELIKAAPQLELIREPDLGVVLFRRLGWKPEDYDAWAQRLHQDQVAFIPPTKWEGETVGRFAFLHPDTGLGLVREVLARTE